MKKENIKKFCLSFVFYIILQFKFINDAWFGTDELDIMVLGKSIARGHLLYRDLCSQHMPFSYYISAFFDMIGFRTVDEQRLAFYILIAALWALIYVRYSHVLGGKVLFFAPAVFCSVLQSYPEMGTEILSEHLAGCGAVILLLEYLDFLNTHRITYKTSIMISIAVVLTFGTLFIAIYAVFFIGLGVLLCEIQQLIKEKGKITKWFAYMIKKYVKLIVIVAFPWCLLFIYYVATGTLRDFVYGAYTLNRTIYSEYMGGFGTNVFSLFLQPLDRIAGYFTNKMNIAEFSYPSILFWIMLLGCVVFVGQKWLEGKRTESIIILMFTCALGMRGIFDYHGTACVEVLTLLFTYVCANSIIGTKDEFRDKSALKQAMVYVLIFFVMSGYFKDISEITTIKINASEPGWEAQVVNALTNEDEAVWCPVFHNDILMLADRPIGLSYPTTPWTWKAYKKNFKKDTANPARVMIYYTGHDVWGNLQEDYAKPLGKFVKKEYTQINESNIYVRNDYYDEAMKIIETLN